MTMTDNDNRAIRFRRRTLS